jgi:SAM-dependent methyltransferase
LYIRRARRRARSEGLNVPFVRCDMRRLPFEGRFDAVVNWFTSFGYFDAAGNLAAARAAFASLRPGGRFLVEMLNKSFVLPRFTSRGDEEASGVGVLRHTFHGTPPSVVKR